MYTLILTNLLVVFIMLFLTFFLFISMILLSYKFVRFITDVLYVVKNYILYKIKKEINKCD